MEDLIDKTLKKIKQDQIKPVASWRVSWHNYLFWATFVLLIFFSGISLAFIIHFSSELDWDILPLISQHKIQVISKVLPFFWILMLLLFSWLSFVNFRYTRKGYRYSNRRLLVVIFGLSLGLGTLAYVLDTSRRLHNALKVTIPQYRCFNSMKENFWTQPELGLLGGEIISVEDQLINLRDFEGHGWKVISDENTQIRPRVVIEERRLIKVVGEKELNYIFKAREIRPWEGGQKIPLVWRFRLEKTQN